MPAHLPHDPRASAPARARPAPEGPRILRIPEAWLPGPIWTRKVLYVIGGRPYLWLSERWRAGDLTACPTSSSPDPERPGQAISVRLIDWTRGAIVPALGPVGLAEAIRTREAHELVRAGQGLPAVLRAPAGGPQPTSAWHFGYAVAGAVYLMVDERWRAQDAWNSASPCFPDTQRPGVMLTTRLLDAAAGEIIPDASRAELPPPPAAPAARPARQGGR